MLYRLKKEKNVFDKLEALPFMEFAELGKVEKDLEVLLADHLLSVLFEDEALMPIFQERALQAEADLYALNKDGDLIIFELKRGFAGEEAMLQVLRYSQVAGQWTYTQLEKKYALYCSSKGLPEQLLAEAHRESFNLDRPLIPSEFNRRQNLIVAGNAANDSLINAVRYWKSKGLPVDFIPYRVYEIGKEYYFEFFALPFDRHMNPASIKGVLFDTNRSYDEDSIWEMIENKRVAAYGDAQYVVEYLNPKDIVFLCHRWVGIVAAGEVMGPVKSVENMDEQFRDLKFLTPVPDKQKGIIPNMPFSIVSQVTGKSFFWARTIKVPYLTRDEAMTLLDECPICHACTPCIWPVNWSIVKK